MNACDSVKAEAFPGGPYVAVAPLRASWRVQRRLERACSHHWHPADPMIRWFCCNCGADRDGMPQDGRDRRIRDLFKRVGDDGS